MNELFGKPGVIERLATLDRRVPCGAATSPYRMVLVGGAALLLKDACVTGRMTRDIDVLEAPFELLPGMGGLDMSNAVQTYEFRMPYGMRGRLERVDLGLESLEVLVPSDADLAVSKLISGRPADLDDVAGMLSLRVSLAGEVDALLDDPLEVEANVDEGTWDAIVSRWGEVRDGVQGAQGLSDLERELSRGVREQGPHRGGDRIKGDRCR